jgi:hypothetical protein
MRLLKWLLIGGAIAWVWNKVRGRQPEALPASTSSSPVTTTGRTPNRYGGSST